MDLDMTSYCAREVEPMGKECEQLHIIALTEYLGLKVSIEYLDGRLASIVCVCEMNSTLKSECLRRSALNHA